MYQMFMKIELCEAIPFRMPFPGECSWAGQTLSWVTLGHTWTGLAQQKAQLAKLLAKHLRLLGFPTDSQ